jgi:hypothetical protein
MQIPDAVLTLERDLRDVFGGRLQSLVAYRAVTGDDRSPVPTLAVVNDLTTEDLRACMGRIAAWHDAGLDTPLLLAAHEFGRSLDACPFEFGAILADHVVVSGVNPFEGLRVDPAHLRHACEIQVRSHLLHLREGYLETRGRGDVLADLIVRSAPPFAALVRSVARLQGAAAPDSEAAARTIERTMGLPDGSLTDVVKLSTAGSLPSDDARRLFPRYLEGVERLTEYIDRWSVA